MTRKSTSLALGLALIVALAFAIAHADSHKDETARRYSVPCEPASHAVKKAEIEPRFVSLLNQCLAAESIHGHVVIAWSLGFELASWMPSHSATQAFPPLFRRPPPSIS